MSGSGPFSQNSFGRWSCPAIGAWTTPLAGWAAGANGGPTCLGRLDIASFLGVYLSFFIDSAPAPTIVLLMTIAFIAAFVLVTNRAARLQRREAALAVDPIDPGGGQSRA